MSRRELKLTEEQRQELAQRRDHDPRPYVRERCAAMLKIADGQAANAVARSALLKPRDPDTLYDWMDHFEQEGVAGLIGHRHGGSEPRPFCEA